MSDVYIRVLFKVQKKTQPFFQRYTAVVVIVYIYNIKNIKNKLNF